MPTYKALTSFWNDWAKLLPEEQAQFLQDVDQFYDDLKAGEGFRNGLRVKGVRGHDGIWEMT